MTGINRGLCAAAEATCGGTRMSLERVGKMTVEIVGDPMVAVEAIIRFKPDLVMLDWMMPGMDGPTLFRKLKQEPQTKDLPVIFITQI